MFASVTWLNMAAGDAKRKVQCIRSLPRDAMAVLCGAIALMRVDLRLQVPACHANWFISASDSPSHWPQTIGPKALG